MPSTFASVQHARLMPLASALPDLDAEAVDAPEVVANAQADVIEPAPATPVSGTALSFSPGSRVSEQLAEFASREGWQLAWEIDRDFPIEYPATFTGDFFSIVEQIVVSLQNSDAPIRVKVYEANRVLRVVHATQ
ncbi:toxin co-regulated pilus biosynthesis Q family protein [Pandoraea sp. NPDC087047]|uniref:toxin co-regulated pilus biosynthesis Q family protein n=1 Tax=Pandoraea sp. NPDC087047 TaxID=3364390 RepID=UPI0038187810